MNNYLMYLSIDDKVVTYSLPAINDERILINCFKRTGKKDFYLSFEVWDNQWYILSNSHVSLSKEGKRITVAGVKEGDVFNGIMNNDRTPFVIMVMAANKDVSVYKKYDISNKQNVSIGAAESNDLVIGEKYVSQNHARIYRQTDGWYISDQSSNGTYLNNRRLHGVQKLSLFDTVYILGVKMIFLKDILAVNHIDSVSSKSLKEADFLLLGSRKVYHDRSQMSRSPRFIEPLDKEKIEIEAPPQRNKAKGLPAIFVLGPSLTMPIPILCMVIFNILINRSREGAVNPFMYFGMVISVVMFAGLSVMWTLMRKRYEDRTKLEDETARITAYEAYIQKYAALLEQKQAYNRNILAQNYLDSETLVNQISKNRAFLWNRNVNHEDFLHIRLGIGTIPSPNEIIVPADRFSLENDPLADRPRELLERYQYLAQAVKTLDLRHHKIIGVVGNETQTGNIIRNMIVQIVALHAYTDVKLAFITGEKDFEELISCFKWLPHVFSTDKKIRYIASGEKSSQEMLYALGGEMRRREELVKEHTKPVFPYHFVIVCTDQKMLYSEGLHKYMADDADYAVTFVLIDEGLGELPNECKMVVEYNAHFSGAYRLDETFGQTNSITFDGISVSKAEKFARSVSGIHVHEVTEGEIPDHVDFLGLLGIGNIQQWELLRHYKENKAHEGLKALIGVTAGNKPMYLDITEKKHGPHGLVAGTTGSGKSETIQTFILSLALNYHPNELAFVLIDFKGGGMADLFDGLPHIAGMITNLGPGQADPATAEKYQTHRALTAIRSEVVRREQLLRANEVKHIDDYIQLFRSGLINEPMPHLVIISDEFAELRKEQPEFIRELVSVARVGRSLGIHLILATQKPAGVVDDEIWSNARFKLCLRVQDKQDSIGMLRRPDAAYLTNTGRAYVQIGNDELFEMFQAAYSGGIYEAKEKQLPYRDEDIAMVGLDGTKRVIRHKHKESNELADTQLDICIDFISSFARQKEIPYTRMLWMPLLPVSLALDEITGSGQREHGSGIAVGIVDDPKHQRQFPLTLDMESTANLMIVGAMGTGKSTMLQTILLAMAKQLGPEQFWFYGIDFSSRSLAPLAGLPHCGGVAYQEDEEKISRLFNLLEQEVTKRDRQLADMGVSSFSEYRRSGDYGMPLIMLIVDNYSGLLEHYADFDDQLADLTRKGPRYGIQTVLTAYKSVNVRSKVSQNFIRIMGLALSERSDYMDVLGRNPDFLPLSYPGRGLMASGQEILEYQTALPVGGLTELERNQKLRAAAASYGEYYEGARARQIPVLPAEETYEIFLGKHSHLAEEKQLLPVGYYTDDLEIYGLEMSRDYCFAISDTTGEGIRLTMKNMMNACRMLDYEMHLVTINSGNYITQSEYVKSLCHDYDTMFDLLLSLREIFKQRSDMRKAYIKAHGEKELVQFVQAEFSKIFIFIDNIYDFESLIYTEHKEKERLYPIIELFFQRGAGHHIFFVAGLEAGLHSKSKHSDAVSRFTKYKTGLHLGGQNNLQNFFEFGLSHSVNIKQMAANEGYTLKRKQADRVFLPLPEQH